MHIQPKFSELRTASDALPGSFLNDPFKNEVFHLIGSAEDNANDSMEEDSERHEWEGIAMRSLEMALCDRSTSQAARDWFTARGVKF